MYYIQLLKLPRQLKGVFTNGFEKSKNYICVFVKHYAPKCMLVSKLAVSYDSFIYSNEVNVNFLKKLYGCLYLTCILKQNISFLQTSYKRGKNFKTE